MLSMPRLVKRGAAYYFRIAVPKHLVMRVGRAELSVSLRTNDPLQARVRCRRISSAVEIFFEGLRKMPNTSIAEVNERIRGYFQDCLNQGEEYVQELPADPKIDIKAEISGLHEMVARLRSDLSHAKFGPAVVSDAIRILPSSIDTGDKPDLEASQYACRAIMRAQIEHWRILEAKLTGNYAAIEPQDPLFAGMKATGLPPLPGEVESPGADTLTFKQAVDLYLEQKTPVWAPKTIEAVTYALGLAASIFGGEKPLRLYGTADKKQLRDVLAKVPPNYRKLKPYAGMSASEAAAANISGPRLSPKTQVKNLEFLGSFLLWAMNEEYIDKLPGVGVKVSGAKKHSYDDRDPCSPSQLAQIFASPLFSGCKSRFRRADPGKYVYRDGYYWVPLIALYSGMRPAEVIQLLTSDIKEVDGIWVFDNNQDEKGIKRFKNPQSMRKVPIHQELIELGFLEHVAKSNPKGRLFPEIKRGSKGSWSEKFSKWWGRYAQRAGFARPKTSFYSLRHNFKDAVVLASIPEQFAKALMGHKDTSVHASYGSGLPLSLLKAEIDKITYNLDH